MHKARKFEGCDSFFVGVTWQVVQISYIFIGKKWLLLKHNYSLGVLNSKVGSVKFNFFPLQLS